MIFVDTGAWFASVVPWDANHAAAATWLAQNQERLITTDYVVDEMLTLLRVRKESKRAMVIGDLFFEQKIADLYFLQAPDLRQAWDVFSNFDDKEWSFTDCTSKVVIEKFQIAQAFAFDDHFRQFGTVHVVP